MFKMVLWILVLMIFGMILIGGLTRLTGSGLSIVEWQPLMGILPPLNAGDWMELFQKYQTSPEYQKVNSGMTLSEFQNIFWLEYIHRVWGRAIGLVLAIPLLMSFLKPTLRSYRGELVLLSLLMAGQGVMGWYMVASGLVDDPHVSPYRLTAHLLLGIIILAMAFWMAMRATVPSDDLLGYSGKTVKGVWKLAFFSLIFVVVTLLYGGLVAGHKAGLIYNTYPLMGGHFIPSDFFSALPFWENMIGNPVAVQWAHRWLGTMTAFLIIILGSAFWKKDLPPRVQMLLRFMMGMAGVQMSLGLSTLLLVVPVDVALIHQAGALLLLLLNVALLKETSVI